MAVSGDGDGGGGKLETAPAAAEFGDSEFGDDSKRVVFEIVLELCHGVDAKTKRTSRFWHPRHRHLAQSAGGIDS